MFLLNNNLYIPFDKMVKFGIPERNLKRLQEPIKISHPTDHRKKLICYELLKDKYKAIIKQHLKCDPYLYAVQDPIKKLVEWDYKAEEFYSTYQLPDGADLPEEYQQKYTIACGWLNMIDRVLADKKALKKALNIQIKQFWKGIAAVVKAEKIDIPTAPSRIKEKLAKYKAGGYESIVETWRFTQKNAAKIGKSDAGYDESIAEKQMALIRKAGRMHNNFDAAQITRSVNIIFKKNGWPEVSQSTVYNYLRKYDTILLPGKRGAREYHNTRAMQIDRKRPDYPLYMVTLDGWTVELLYQEHNQDEGKTTYENRLVMVVVLDPSENYPLGYAIGDRENTALIRQACRNAELHIKELFGDYYRPWQIQSDHYGLKTMTPFYNGLGYLFTPAAVGNAKSKVIEPYFKYLNKNHCQYHYNWGGFGVKARKESQPNAEYLNKIKQSFPDKAGVIRQIVAMMEYERANKINAFMARWNSTVEDDKVVMNREQWLRVFGYWTGETNSIEGKGLHPAIEGQKLWFDTFNPKFRELDRYKWKVLYDKDDLSSILAVSEDDKYSFLLEHKRQIDMSVRGQIEGDSEHRSAVQQFNKERREEIIQIAARDAELVDEVINNTPLALDDYQEARLKLMFTYSGQQKERIQDAKKLGIARKAKSIEQKQEKAEQKELMNVMEEQRKAYLNTKVDINKYV